MPFADAEEYKAYQRQRYALDKPRRLKKQSDKEKRRRRHLNAYKVRTGCSHCGYKDHPAALDFHHLRDKVKGIPAMMSHSLPNLFKEIRKCIVLCANCHRIEHNTKSIKSCE
jgi:hypothetical protein